MNPYLYAIHDPQRRDGYYFGNLAAVVAELTAAAAQ